MGKSLPNLRADYSLFFAFYNLVWNHSTLKRTPAQALGITPRAWSVEELVEAAQKEPVPEPLETPRPDPEPKQIYLGKPSRASTPKLTAVPVATQTAAPVATQTAVPVLTQTAAPVAMQTAAPIATKTAAPVATQTAEHIAQRERNLCVVSKELTTREKAVLEVIAKHPKITIAAIAADAFPDLSGVQANSWTRNQLRGLRDRKLVEKIGKGLYQALATKAADASPCSSIEASVTTQELSEQAPVDGISPVVITDAEASLVTYQYLALDCRPDVVGNCSARHDP
jgi:hypothetical protein